jgi:hypothetical protein
VCEVEINAKLHIYLVDSSTFPNNKYGDSDGGGSDDDDCGGGCGALSAVTGTPNPAAYTCDEV